MEPKTLKNTGGFGDFSGGPPQGPRRGVGVQGPSFLKSPDSSSSNNSSSSGGRAVARPARGKRAHKAGELHPQVGAGWGARVSGTGVRGGETPRF